MYSQQGRKGQAQRSARIGAFYVDLELEASRAAAEREAPARISAITRALQSRLRTFRNVVACKEIRRRGVEAKLMWRGSRMHAKWLIADEVAMANVERSVVVRVGSALALEK